MPNHSVEFYTCLQEYLYKRTKDPEQIEILKKRLFVVDAIILLVYCCLSHNVVTWDYITMFALITSTGIVQLKFLKHGCHGQNTQQENGTITDRWGNSYLLEQWNKGTNHSRPYDTLWYKWCQAISWPCRLKKTSSNESKRCDLHPNWLHHETNDYMFYYYIKMC